MRVIELVCDHGRLPWESVRPLGGRCLRLPHVTRVWCFDARRLGAARTNVKTADAISTRLARCYTGSLFDALRERGERCVALPSDIRLLDPRKPIAGPRVHRRGRQKGRPQRTKNAAP